MGGTLSDPEEKAEGRVTTASGGRGESRGAPAPRFREMRFPGARSVLWSPGPGAGDGGLLVEYPAVLTQAVLRVVHDHLRGGRETARFGFLLGDLYRCTDTGRSYALVDTVLPAAEPFVEKSAESCLLKAWARSQEAFLRRAGILLGWYHSHPGGAGIELSEPDRAAFRKYFREAWQIAVVVAPDPVQPFGGVFRHMEEPDGPRPGLVPFYELLEEPAEGRLVPSAVRWRNYERRLATLAVESGESGRNGSPPAEAAPSGEIAPRAGAMGRRERRAARRREKRRAGERAAPGTPAAGKASSAASPPPASKAASPPAASKAASPPAASKAASPPPARPAASASLAAAGPASPPSGPPEAGRDAAGAPTGDAPRPPPARPEEPRRATTTAAAARPEATGPATRAATVPGGPTAAPGGPTAAAGGPPAGPTPAAPPSSRPEVAQAPPGRAGAEPVRPWPSPARPAAASPPERPAERPRAATAQPSSIPLVMTVRPEDVLPRRIAWKRLAERAWFRGAAGALAVALVVFAARELWRPVRLPISLAPPAAPGEAATVVANPLAGLNADLEAALDRYGQRRGDFELGLIGCELLAGGYAGADEAFVAAARVFGRIGAAGPDMEEVAKFEQLAARMDGVNRHFDDAGCARPR